MRLEINIASRQAAFLVVFTVVVLTISVVIAYNEPPGAGVPSVMGHSVDELNLEPLYVDYTNDRVGIGEPNPGQALDVVGQIHASDDICTDSGGGTCLSDAGGGTLSCVTRTASDTDGIVFVGCDSLAGEIATGGGFVLLSGSGSSDIRISRPDSPNGWRCDRASGSATITCYVQCCKID